MAFYLEGFVSRSLRASGVTSKRWRNTARCLQDFRRLDVFVSLSGQPQGEHPHFRQLVQSQGLRSRICGSICHFRATLQGRNTMGVRSFLAVVAVATFGIGGAAIAYAATRDSSGIVNTQT